MKTSTKEWLKAAGTRALKTVAQTAVATIGVSAAMQDVNWLAVGSASLLAGILSVLTSVAGLPEVNSKKQHTNAQNAHAPEQALINSSGAVFFVYYIKSHSKKSITFRSMHRHTPKGDILYIKK